MTLHLIREFLRFTQVPSSPPFHQRLLWTFSQLEDVLEAWRPGARSPGARLVGYCLIWQNQADQRLQTNSHHWIHLYGFWVLVSYAADIFTPFSHADINDASDELF